MLDPGPQGADVCVHGRATLGAAAESPGDDTEQLAIDSQWAAGVALARADLSAGMSCAHHAIRESWNVLGIAEVTTPQLHLGELEAIRQLQVLVDGAEAADGGQGVRRVVGIGVGQLNCLNSAAQLDGAAEAYERHVKVLRLRIVLRMDDQLSDVQRLAIASGQVRGAYHRLHLAGALANGAVGRCDDHRVGYQGAAAMVASPQLQRHLMRKLARRRELAANDASHLRAPGWMASDGDQEQQQRSKLFVA